MIYPAVMQGAQAPASILQALEKAAEEGYCQTIIIARGGGSSEDLSAFNDESLVRGVYCCPIPVISAVGHEVDFTLLDYVADARASTPTGACAIAAPDFGAVRKKINEYPVLLQRLIDVKLSNFTQEIERLLRLILAKSPQNELKKNRQRLDYLIKLIIDAQEKKIWELERQNQLSLTRLELLNPAALMLRGYSITQKGKEVITCVDHVCPGDHITTRVADGAFESTVTVVKKGAGIIEGI